LIVACVIDEIFEPFNEARTTGVDCALSAVGLSGVLAQSRHQIDVNKFARALSRSSMLDSRM
jgi:hypothetical protein